ncbi:hypothetical protein ACFOW4_01890 [Micromonospora sp. GCM10011542]|uniref:hypothetical protein n=1 Tax=Micromonospora sp. GCM10011542 TaxID=3317337 RepID=UPI00361E4623
MSTHRRAWKQRAGVVVALVAGALLAVPATPALAAPDVTDVSASPSSVEAGKTTKISYKLAFQDGAQPADISFSSSNPKLTCVDGCSRGRVTESGTYDATFKLADDAANGTAQITVKATDSNGPIKQSQDASTTVTLVAKAAPPQQAQTVRSISGKVVKKADSEAVPNAFVVLQDTAGHRYDTMSDGSGNFRFTGTTEKPIAPGRIDLGASFDNIKAFKTVNATAGQAVTGQRIALEIKVEVTPSATPSASAEATPTEEATEEGAAEEPSEEPSPGAPANAANNEDDGGGFGSYLIILLGGLLVAAGVGTIVLLWMRRKESGDDDADVPAGAAGAVPAARGAYRDADDRTRVVNRVGGGPDPTMAGGAALSDAPTMMHRPVVDDVPPDPYGAPAQPYGAAGQQNWGGASYGEEPASGGYGAGGYGAAPASGGGYGTAATPEAGYGAGAPGGEGYGAAPGSGAGYGGAPSSGGGYGSRDYGAPAGDAAYPPAPAGPAYGERYDEPTGRYTGDSTQYPAPADPYATGVYQPEQGAGYGQADPAPYGRGAEPAGGGYNQRGGYEQGGYGQAGGYGQESQPEHGSYGQEAPPQRGGYEQGGYGQAPGYGQDAPTQRGGYDDRGYEQGGYYGDQGQAGRARPDAPPQQDRGGRRLDWLDD